MTDPLRWLEPLVRTPEDAVRWACLLEATAPKPGNVFPGRPFTNLTYLDFVRAAEITADCFGRAGRVSQGMLDAVVATASQCQSNVNLGIVLLLGPLVAADRCLIAQGACGRTPEVWREAIGRQLQQMDEVDGQNVFRAIASASAGGLGKVDTMDVHATHSTVDLLQAMTLAADRDRIARQYSTGFVELVDLVAPTLQESMIECGDVMQGICQAHIRLLVLSPDSLIARKNGVVVAERVQSLARSVSIRDRESVEQFDASLRSPDHKLNPGTTADLIAAGLYLLLRTLVDRESEPTIDQDQP